MWFGVISRLRINLDKNEILLMRRVDNSKILALELDCKAGTLPFSYLGLPLGALHKSVAVWDGVEERFRKRLAIRQFIFKGRRITHIRRPFYWGGRGFGEEASSCEVRDEYSVGLWKEIKKEVSLLNNKIVFSVRRGLESSFSRPFNDGEVEMVEMVERWFLVTLQGKRVITDLEDRVLWKEETKDGKFSVKSLYGALELRTAVSFLRSTIWSPCVPTKVGFFA
ncbi:hypothetical protein CK203_095076 [Vitis vinifera]|uniref:Uncharacterized protein n=1 Tax=Vitis vinifera TaxID=29760 RepID=A0A438EWL7_VITVI|nr:hypothetical protein CK203_095076 [Vitis vinifera]